MIRPHYSWYMKQADIQSVLASSRFRKNKFSRPDNPLMKTSQAVILDLPDNIQLQGFYSPNSGNNLAVLLHGWEGSAQSSYILATASTLYAQGMSVFRLQLRDHGETHHLNEDIFHSCRIQEVVDALENIAEKYQAEEIYLAGFSLGGNFALRVALNTDIQKVPLQHVVAVSPVIDARTSLRSIESALPFYRWYFLRKWQKSLLLKAKHFPQRYNFNNELQHSSLMELTRILVENYTEYDCVDDYFDGYSIAGKRLKNIPVSTHIITSSDDPVIPVEDFYQLELPEKVKLTVLPHGGHCGFIENLSLKGWIEEQISREFTCQNHEK
ncbi:MAG: YheT family hydrolase [bacterium]